MNKRRDNVPFDPYYFEKQASLDVTFSLSNTFRHIYQTNHWRGSDSVSGEGASSTQTQQIEAKLPALLKTLQVDVLLDLPCGDFSWMQLIDLPVSRYIGADIVSELILENQKRYGSQNHQFLTLDFLSEPLPTADLLLCRDCFVHLSFGDIFSALNNMKRSQITYLLTTTFPNCEENEDITTGDWRLLNLEKPPFSFPTPLQLINEQCSEGGGIFRDKSLGLWLLQDIHLVKEL
ncbi:class I SAM-dependent methyltransferase [Brasilonema octagenarum UFV-E1]|uniref:Class I SAM-dependent methyltransferase n=1 Tax=Brasilonema sennae CENA114 TaxID=415709 RepID=A0A856MKS9_9CYAN|nr:class I SAM-dependent methyltransferase [Brasilonema sennae]QDL11983.1 class I SAM-dependent methyltransferase [Brasilonema sennae CENA114]QDL18358.1 class I SAM-dependent methyltransferase [Brasilonema octagenarum UFV-E1]